MGSYSISRGTGAFIRMMYDTGIHTPVIECNVCRRRIEDAAKAVVLYGYDPGDEGYGRPDECDRQIIVHKGRCDRSVRRAYMFWQDLSVVLVWLAHNLKFDERARAEAETKAQMIEAMS